MARLSSKYYFGEYLAQSLIIGGYLDSADLMRRLFHFQLYLYISKRRERASTNSLGNLWGEGQINVVIAVLWFDIESCAKLIVIYKRIPIVQDFVARMLL